MKGKVVGGHQRAAKAPRMANINPTASMRLKQGQPTPLSSCFFFFFNMSYSEIGNPNLEAMCVILSNHLINILMTTAYMYEPKTSMKGCFDTSKCLKIICATFNRLYKRLAPFRHLTLKKMSMKICQHL